MPFEDKETRVKRELATPISTIQDDVLLCGIVCNVLLLGKHTICMGVVLQYKSDILC